MGRPWSCAKPGTCCSPCKCSTARWLVKTSAVPPSVPQDPQSLGGGSRETRCLDEFLRERSLAVFQPPPLAHGSAPAQMPLREKMPPQPISCRALPPRSATLPSSSPYLFCLCSKFTNVKSLLNLLITRALVSQSRFLISTAVEHVNSGYTAAPYTSLEQTVTCTHTVYDRIASEALTHQQRARFITLHTKSRQRMQTALA